MVVVGSQQKHCIMEYQTETVVCLKTAVAVNGAVGIPALTV